MMNPERKQPKAKPAWLGSIGPVRQSTAGAGLRVGAASAVLPPETLRGYLWGKLKAWLRLLFTRS